MKHKVALGIFILILICLVFDKNFYEEKNDGEFYQYPVVKPYRFPRATWDLQGNISTLINLYTFLFLFQIHFRI